jgi:hypothetical protein
MTVIGARSSFRKRREMSPHKRASRQRLISWRQADFRLVIRTFVPLSLAVQARSVPAYDKRPRLFPARVPFFICPDPRCE